MTLCTGLISTSLACRSTCRWLNRVVRSAALQACLTTSTSTCTAVQAAQQIQASQSTHCRHQVTSRLVTLMVILQEGIDCSDCVLANASAGLPYHFAF